MSSRIIITTRIIDVAKEAGSCYMLKPLSLENSEKLFHGRIFGSKEKCPSKFLDVSKTILKKCGGVPLAIVTTSSLLATKSSENIKEWHDVCDSIGSGLEKKPGMDSMMKILLLSYYDLPSHLKTCLLYLSIFPEDCKIRKNRLIWRWVAEGFVQGQQAGDRSFLQIGESYFNELLNRSLIQLTDMNWDGTTEACHVHDMVLDLIISLSMEESFVTTLSGDGKLSLGSKQEVRRLSLHSFIAWPTVIMPKMRSLTIFEPAVSNFKLLPHDVGVGSLPSLSSYHLLRVLDLRDYKLKDLASMGFVGSLSHLRYLGLSTNAREVLRPGGDMLPVEIGKLHFLQTLDISGTEVKELASSMIAGLRRLMCLCGGGLYYRSRTRLPNGLKNLTSLEVLKTASVPSECIAKELGYLTRLRVLEIGVSIRPHRRRMHRNIDGDDDNEWNACTSAFVESLGKLKEIESLRICKNSLKALCYDGSMEEPLDNLRQLRIDYSWAMPTWIEPASLPGLTGLNIRVQRERKADIHVLGTLPCLRHLKLEVTLKPEEKPLERCKVGDDAFPCLVKCELDIRMGVVPSMFPRGAMPKLEDFTFNIRQDQFWSSCGESVATVDDLALGHLPSLRSVAVAGLHEDYEANEVCKRLREKLEHEAAVHPNHPLRIKIRVMYLDPYPSCTHI
jgi:disease resistance protein RPM1